MTLEAQIQLHLGDLDLDVTLSMAAGGVVAVLGPNGAGKTTLLRALGGLCGIDDGHIKVDGTVLADTSSSICLPPEHRPVAMVFQDYLLFPHLSALDNVAFGLRTQGASKADARTAARHWLDRVGLSGSESQRPESLSGGQAQRVALARALATEPALLLLDEPLAALDAATRTLVRRDLRRYLDDFEGVTVLVTHDPLDALALAQQVMIIERGYVTQAGTLAEVTSRPRSRYVADLIGVNLLHGEADGTTVVLTDYPGVTVALADPTTGSVFVLIRPHSVALHHREPDSSARNRWPLRIEGFDLLGDRVRVRLTGMLSLIAEVTPAAVAAMDLRAGQDIWATVKATDLETYPS